MSTAASSAGSGRAFGHVRQVLEGAVLDRVDLRRVDPECADEPRAAVLGVHDDGVRALVEAALRAELAGARLAREDVVRRDDDRPRARQQMHVERLEREPLEVHDVRGARRAAVAQHVRDVRRELRGEAPPRARGAAGAAVEPLDALVAVGRGHRSVREAARLQAHAGRRRERAPRTAHGRRAG